MKVSTKRNTVWVWLSALILFVFVAASSIVLFGRLNSFLLDDRGAISLLEHPLQAEAGPETTETAPAGEGAATEEAATEEPEAASVTGETAATEQPATETASAGRETTRPAASAAPLNPQPADSHGFAVSDGNGLWSSETPVDIFRVSYENGEQQITVNSQSGEKLIAPGTDHSYTFKLKNTGNVALDYSVELDAYITPSDISIPIQARLNRYDGTWIVGGQDRYESVPVLDAAMDRASLGAGKYTYYTLDWRWPFEGENDAWDTALGNLAVDQDLVFAIVIRTRAATSSDPGSGGGITPPYTGDDSKLTVWIVLAVSAAAIMILLLFYLFEEKRRHDAEADKK